MQIRSVLKALPLSHFSSTDSAVLRNGKVEDDVVKGAFVFNVSLYFARPFQPQDHAHF